MQTKLSRFSEGLMEAVWLAALIIVPVFFNVYSSRIFEPDKIAIMRSLALVGLGAWLVKAVEEGGVHWENFRREGESSFRAFLRTPLLPYVAALALVYVIATLFSVTPRVSFWGSYQRLQGTYTMLSYMVIFSMVAATLRRKAQIERLVSVVILASLPIGLYGILQRFEIDPIPWGGDTSRRVAANMGNAIFVAAYLIMAFPLTLGRIVDSFAHILREDDEALVPQTARGTVYVFTAAIQLITIYFSLSRGPILGLLAGTFFIFVLLSLYWGKRWMTLTTIGTAGALGLFLVLLSIPNGPLETLRSNENIGRLGRVFETDSGTGRVRVLIWEGASELVWFHEPIRFPDGSEDRVNLLRPLIGYGPESMYVAYNPFYPSELANIEARNASPDRSHNETWDSLVITGIFGLLAEQALFVAVFYYGLQWLGLVSGRRQRALFFGLIAGGGLASAVVFITLAGIGFLGVGLPFGMLIGLLVYLSLISIYGRYQPPESGGERTRWLYLVVFLGAIITHYVEIHFGIAIVATRTYFFIYTGALMAIGYSMTLQGVFGKRARAKLVGLSDNAGETVTSSPAEPAKAGGKGPRKARRGRKIAAAPSPAWIGALLLGILMVTLSFNYITNPDRQTSVTAIIWDSLTVLSNRNGLVSYGILAIFFTAFLASVVVFAAEWAQDHPEAGSRTLLIVGLGGLGIWIAYAFFHAVGLLRIILAAVSAAGQNPVFAQATQLEGLLTQFYFIVFLLLLWLAWNLARTIPAARRESGAGGRGLLAGVGALAVVLLLVLQFNLRIIHADMAFKMADPFGRGDSADSWRTAISLYQRANAYAPSEDHYYLFLGRGYLELSRLLQNSNLAEMQQLLSDAERDLERAQEINPLNTDHTANLARLHRFWASVVPDPAARNQLIEESSDYYASAVLLSPQNAVIWNEWATLHLGQLQDPEGGLALLERSLSVDPFFHGTYGILGDYYSSLARSAATEAERQETLAQATDYFEAAIENTRPGDRGQRYTYLIAIGGLYAQFDDLRRAVEIYQEALEQANDRQRWAVQDTLAKIYAQLGNYDLALAYAVQSFENASEEQKPQQQQLIDFLRSQQQPEP